MISRTATILSLYCLTIFSVTGSDKATTEGLDKRGTSKTFLQTSRCMQNVTRYCSRKCAAEEDGQKMYLECLSRDDIATAYEHGFELFHKCVGGQNPCLKINVTTDYGQDCWGECSGDGYRNCLKGCKSIEVQSEEGQAYLHCATQINGAHSLFWQCLQDHVTPLDTNGTNIVVPVQEQQQQGGSSENTRNGQTRPGSDEHRSGEGEIYRRPILL